VYEGTVWDFSSYACHVKLLACHVKLIFLVMPVMLSCMLGVRGQMLNIKGFMKINWENKYIRSLLWIIGGIVAMVVTSPFVASGTDIEVRRGLPPMHSIFFIGSLSVFWGLLKLFLSLLEFKEPPHDL